MTTETRERKPFHDVALALLAPLGPPVAPGGITRFEIICKVIARTVLPKGWNERVIAMIQMTADDMGVELDNESVDAALHAMLKQRSGDMDDFEPFHESILGVMDTFTAAKEDEFNVICELIAATKVPKGHEEILIGLRLLRASGQFPMNYPIYVETVKAIHRGLVEREPEAANT